MLGHSVWSALSLCRKATKQICYIRYKCLTDLQQIYDKLHDFFLFFGACGMMRKMSYGVFRNFKQDAKECFKQGLNCSECVMTAFLNHFDTGLPKEVVKLATGFGGGMGHTKNTCGAITGAVMALSAIVGRENPAAKETVGERITELQQGIYPVVGKMVNEIKDEYGTLICSELSNPFGDFACKERKKNCMTMIMHCANLAAKYAEEAQK